MYSASLTIGNDLEKLITSLRAYLFIILKTNQKFLLCKKNGSKIKVIPHSKEGELCIMKKMVRKIRNDKNAQKPIKTSITHIMLSPNRKLLNIKKILRK